MSDPYEILGVGRGASQEEIVAAYRRAAMRWHPDRNPDDPLAKERFQEVAQAYQFLTRVVPTVRLNRGAGASGSDSDGGDEGGRRKEAAEVTRRWEAVRREARRRQAAYEEATWRAQAAARVRIESPLYAVAVLAAGGVGFVVLEAPARVVVLSFALLLAAAVAPVRTWTDAVVGVVVRVYFLGLGGWVVWRLGGRLVERFLG